MMEIPGSLLDKCSMQIKFILVQKLDYGGLTGDNATYFGYIKPYYFNTSEYVASVILLDSSHEYQIRYRYYSSNTSTKYMENFTGNYSTITVAADSDCNSNDLQPVTLTTTQLTCLENKVK